MGRCSNAQRWYSPGAGPPPPGSLPPVSGSGTPTPRPARNVPCTPLFLRGNASLSRSKPVAGSLVPRSPLWVSSARSLRIPAPPFLMHPRFARRSHRGRLARCASLTPAVRFFFRSGLSSDRIDHSMLSKNTTIFVTSRKCSFTLMP